MDPPTLVLKSASRWDLPARGVRIGRGVSEVRAAFVARLATVYGDHADPYCDSIGAACNLVVGYRPDDGGE